MVTHENFDKIYDDLKYFMMRYINNEVEKEGNAEILSIKIGELENYVDDVIDRGYFGARTRLYKKIRKLRGVWLWKDFMAELSAIKIIFSIKKQQKDLTNITL